MPVELPELLVADAGAWRRWLADHHTQPDGVWLVLAKKGTTTPTSLTYQQALEGALCFGWIDGQVRRRDEATHMVRFTPRRPRSAWSRRNVGIVERLVAEGRMQPAGLTQVELARADGRWDTAYDGSATAQVPEDLAAALAAQPAAQRLFAELDAQNRYAVLYRLQTARRPETRARRIEQFVAMLAQGETLYPRRAAPPR